MPDAAEKLFEDESLEGGDAAVDDAIRAAGGERPAIRALLVALAEARAALDQGASFGYLRGRLARRKADR